MHVYHVNLTDKSSTAKKTKQMCETHSNTYTKIISTIASPQKQSNRPTITNKYKKITKYWSYGWKWTNNIQLYSNYITIYLNITLNWYFYTFFTYKLFKDIVEEINYTLPFK